MSDRIRRPRRGALLALRLELSLATVLVIGAVLSPELMQLVV